MTRFHPKDAVCLTSTRNPRELGVERPQDGVVHGGRVYFTTVNGPAVLCAGEIGERVQDVDLNRSRTGSNPTV